MTSKSATAGYSIGAENSLVPSFLMAEFTITRSPASTVGSMYPQVPTLMKVSIPSLESSVTAIEAEGPPMSVEVITTSIPS